MRSKRSSHAVSNSSGDSNNNKVVKNKQECRDKQGRAVYGHEVAGSLAFRDNADFDDDNKDSNSDDDDDYSTSSNNSIDASKQACKDVEDNVSILGEMEFTGATVNMDAAKIPDGSRLIDKYSTLNESTRETARQIHDILERRPIVTIRVIKSQLQLRRESDLGEALPVCGYMFTNGPWKKALIKFGVDPRLRPDFRFYQTISFRMEFDPVVEPGKHDWATKGILAFPQLLQGGDNISYVFNGKKFVADGDTWQVCDITDTLLQRILSTEQLRTRVSPQDGFFCNGTMAKLEIIMQDKIVCIRDGIGCDDDEYKCLLAFPDEYEPLRQRDHISYGLDFGQRYTRKQAFLRGRLVNRARRSYERFINAMKVETRKTRPFDSAHRGLMASRDFWRQD